MHGKLLSVGRAVCKREPIDGREAALDVWS